MGSAPPIVTMILPVWACKSLSLGEVTSMSISRCGGIYLLSCNEVVLQLVELQTLVLVCSNTLLFIWFFLFFVFSFAVSFAS